MTSGLKAVIRRGSHGLLGRSTLDTVHAANMNICVVVFGQCVVKAAQCNVVLLFIT